MKRVLIFIFFSWNLYAFSQQKNSIEYLTPEDVKVKVLKFISGNKNVDYYCIWGSQRDTISILVSKLDKSFDEVVSLVENTNRFIRLSDEKKIPIVLSFDLKFSTLLHKVENKGENLESVANIRPNPSGYLIKFTGTYGKSSIVYSEYFQY